ncbi:MAG: SIR2 family protein [Proteobacteria bacterium]|nr:SIR2 family protein [Pseudomonadota bacterium]
MRDPTASPLWRELVGAGANGHLVVLVGAGASVPAGRPRWDELLNELFRRAHDDAFPEQQEHLRAAQEFERSERAEALVRVMGRPWLENAIVERLSAPSLQPAPVHHALVALPGTRLLTTNYDTLLEQAAEANGHPLEGVTAADTAKLARDQPMVLKLHGCVTRPETIVLTVADYDRLIHRAPAAWRERLRSFLQPPFCLVMVGYGFGDSNIQGVLAELRVAYEDHLAGPIWIEPSSAGAELKAPSYGLRQLPIEAYADLAPLLQRLGEAIKGSRAKPPAIVGPLLDVASEHLGELVQQARAHFDAGDDAAGQECLNRALNQAETLARAEPEDEALRCELARARLNRVAAYLLLGQQAEGRALLERVEAGALVARPETLAQLACMWVELEDPARARQVLECVAGEWADADRAALEEARQRVAIAEGTLPEELLTPRLRLRAARVLMLRNRLDQAVGLVRDARRQAPDDRWLAADALPLLVYCLERSVHENPPAEEPVAVSARAEILEVAEAAFSTIDGHRFPPPTAGELAHWRARFFGLTHDYERWFDAPVAEEAAGEAASHVGSGGVTPLALALERAKAGHLQEALALLEDERHPWLPALNQALLLRQVGHLDHAITLLERSAEGAPGSYGIERCWPSYLEREQPQQALPHARLAYQALPGRGARLALAGALVGVARDLESDRGLLDQAWALLEPMASSHWPLTLRLRAQVATSLARPDAVALWEACLAASPGDRGVADRLHMARALWRSARGTEAAEAAWRAFELGAEQLTPQGLGACARFQLVGADPGAHAVARAKAIDRALRRRFPGNLEAEQVHAGIAAMLGFPADLAPVDFPALVASGVARSLDLDELTSLLAAQRTRAGAFIQLYRAGLISTERFCRETRTCPAELLVRVRAAARGSDEVFFATPVGPRVDPLPELRGGELLAGELELLILQQLGLLDGLRRALGPDGRVVVFDDVMAAVERSVATLTLSAGAGALPREQALDKLLRHHARVRREPPESAESAEVLAKRHDLALVAPERPGGTVAWVSLRALLVLMRERGLLRADAAHGALNALPDDGARIEAFPPRLGVSWAVLDTLHQLEGLEPLLREVQELWLPGDAERLRGRRLDELERAAEAARMATDLHRWLAAGHGQGWVARLPRPEAEVLPKGPAEALPNALRALLREELQQALHWRLALEGHPRRVLLTADFLVAALFTGAAPLPVLRQVAWTPETYRALDARMTRLLPQQITLPELVASLAAPAAAQQHARQLAELGFQQALPAQALVRLQDVYGQLRGGEAARLLDRSEWVARAAGHPGQRLARLALARSYADAIWLAWKGAGQGLHRTGPGAVS